jgi:hypothetical protein
MQGKTHLRIVDVLHEFFANIGYDYLFSRDRVGDGLAALLLRLILVCGDLIVLCCRLILGINLLVSDGLVLIEVRDELFDVRNGVGTTPWLVGLLGGRRMRHLWNPEAKVLVAGFVLPFLGSERKKVGNEGRERKRQPNARG